MYLCCRRQHRAPQETQAVVSNAEKSRTTPAQRLTSAPPLLTASGVLALFATCYDRRILEDLASVRKINFTGREDRQTDSTHHQPRGIELLQVARAGCVRVSSVTYMSCCWCGPARHRMLSVPSTDPPIVGRRDDQVRCIILLLDCESKECAGVRT